ncbi:hypothetical protein VUR80DRAFT_7403 [Thermomyces stellatus]
MGRRPCESTDSTLVKRGQGPSAEEGCRDRKGACCGTERKDDEVKHKWKHPMRPVALTREMRMQDSPDTQIGRQRDGRTRREILNVARRSHPETEEAEAQPAASGRL